jgi:molecular chaperone HscC
MNGLLEVEVTNLSTGKLSRKVIEQRPGALGPREIRETLARLAPLKRHPRNEPAHRALLERGERLYAELSGTARDILTRLLDAFETALDRQDPTDITVSRSSLSEFLSQFYADEGETQPGPGGDA